jgi:hypothetical protein
MDAIDIDDEPLKFENKEAFRSLRIFEYESIHSFGTFSVFKFSLKIPDYKKLDKKL